MNHSSSHQATRSLPSAPPEARPFFVRVAACCRASAARFFGRESASGLLLLLAAAIALVWANSPWRASYTALWETPVGLQLGAVSLKADLAWLVNDGLMAVFFFTVGMEIRHELHAGVLSSWRGAALPVFAALGGMLVPALAYLLIAGGPGTCSGWGVPMATDIAFALGVLALLGPRLPAALRVLLLALAVIDDLGAIVVIAIFYSSHFAPLGLVVAAAGFGAVLLLRAAGVRAKLAYLAPAVVTWAGVHEAGIHPTIAGVLLGLVTPVRAWLGPRGVVAEVHAQASRLGADADDAGPSAEALAEARRGLALAAREAVSPAASLLETLHPWVSLGIMPLFALANAGVPLSGADLEPPAVNVLAGVSAGLLLGKPVGVLGASYLALKTGLAAMPRELGWRHLGLLALLAGIGFTMALFIADLAFLEPGLLAAAKLGVLGASALGAVAAFVFGRALLRRSQTG